MRFTYDPYYNSVTTIHHCLPPGGNVALPLRGAIEFMRVIEIPYPEALTAVLHMSPAAFEHEAKMALAVKLFELGRLTSGQAAQLVGVSRVAFLLECHRFGVPSVAWDDDEIAAEFQDA